MQFREYIYKILVRSPSWRQLRKEFLKDNPKCSVCGRDNKLEVHHIKSVSGYPELELDKTNLITLCGGSTKCHFIFGHLGNWRRINPKVVMDCLWFSERFKGR